MRIGFDLRPFLKQETGVGVYFRNLLFELASFDADNEYFLFSASWKDRFPRDRVPPFRRLNFRDLKFPVKAVNFLWHRMGGPSLDRVFGTKLDLTHSPGPLFLPTRGKKIVTVHDLFFLESPEQADREARRTFVGRAGKAIQAADGVLTISQYYRRAILEAFRVDEQRIKVIPHGLDKAFGREPAAEDKERVKETLTVPGTFLLFVGALEPRKNLVRLLEALKILGHRGLDVPLLIVGRPGGDSERVAQAVERLGLGSRVKLLGYLDGLTTRCLYRLATALVFPSLAEGFGLPIVEAMASGLAVAASETSAIPEVAGGAALLFDPASAEDIADKVGQVLENQALRASLVEKGKRRAADFDWRRTAEETLDFYHAI
ncbi:MAG: glycosyltransferase family 4 protein [Candidatus Aminicenantes bacterium]|nr:glycosyltransferase family 4 protein [Candidatus Aminicenantes bacterium]